jgi:NAD(P)-dependent dehydrogenase (short-subunit alcohol dehydrogenase family)
MKEAMQTTLSNKTTTEGSRMKIGTEDNMKRKIALVTGVSSGIGKATAERLDMAGYKVYGTSRRGAQGGRAIIRDTPSRCDQRRFRRGGCHGIDAPGRPH